MRITGYHTLEDRDNVEEIEEHGPYKCTRLRKSWLGVGYYFWDTEIKWAHRWGESYDSGYVIYKAQLNVDDKTLDLFGRIGDRNGFLRTIEELVNRGKFDYESVTVGDVIEYLKKYSKFLEEYNSVRASDKPENGVNIKFSGNRGEGLNLGGDRVQVCLIDKTNMLNDTFELIYPKKYII